MPTKKPLPGLTSFAKTQPGRLLTGVIAAAALVGFLSGVGGTLAALYLRTAFPAFVPDFALRETNETKVVEREEVKYVPQTTQEEKIISIVEQASRSVVSVVATKDVPVIDRFFSSPFGNDEDFCSFFPELCAPQEGGETQRQQISAGTGFVVSADGLVVTNKHVVADTEADYTVIVAGERYSADVLARDPVEDLAILRVEGLSLPPLALGDSESLQPGQTVIAIGNALGELENTVSVGVISGLRRTITASAGFGGPSEILSELVQTDTAINPGNSGGPLLNLSGKVIGINVATASGAENIGFAIPINRAKADIEEVKETGKISFPFLGVRYIQVTAVIAAQNNLPVDYGALVVRGERPGELAVVPGSAADKAGIVENDIILEVNGVRVTSDDTLGELLLRYKPGNTITLKILHKGEEKIVEVTLEERPQG